VRGQGAGLLLLCSSGTRLGLGAHPPSSDRPPTARLERYAVPRCWSIARARPILSPQIPRGTPSQECKVSEQRAPGPPERRAGGRRAPPLERIPMRWNRDAL
jgi:hypothetical protein